MTWFTKEVTMEDVTSLINHLLGTDHSIDSIDSIVHELNISKDRLLQLTNENSYRDFFQLLRPSKNRNPGSEKIALTLDLSCCTHYAQQCKNPSCPFLHLCPYNVKPVHAKCTNKTCPYDHDISKSAHNRQIIDNRGLDFIPMRTLHELTRASADPTRSFWVCNDHGKKGGCPKKSHCDKLHYCYYHLTDACTKAHCQHVLNESCLAYFREKQLTDIEQEDILDAFSKVLRQRKTDYLNPNNVSRRPSSGSSSPKTSTSRDNQRRSTVTQQRQTPSHPRRSTTVSTYDDVLSTKPDSPPPMPEHERDLLLTDCNNEQNNAEVERYLSSEIGRPIKLLKSKNISSNNKETQSFTASSKPIYYYHPCPVQNTTDLFALLRWQTGDKPLSKPVIVYANVLEAHKIAEQNSREKNQFCIFRLHLLRSSVLNGNLLPGNRLQLSDPLIMCFDRMWLYMYNR